MSCPVWLAVWSRLQGETKNDHILYHDLINCLDKNLIKGLLGELLRMEINDTICGLDLFFHILDRNQFDLKLTRSNWVAGRIHVIGCRVSQYIVTIL